LTKTKIVQLCTITTLSIVMLGGCASKTVCDKYSKRGGYYCHQGYNFGKSRSHIYKKGVNNGCRTANGYFVKDYSLSRVSQAYIDGWDAGRTKCRHQIPESAKFDGMRTQYQQAIDQR